MHPSRSDSAAYRPAHEHPSRHMLSPAQPTPGQAGASYLMQRLRAFSLSVPVTKAIKDTARSCCRPPARPSRDDEVSRIKLVSYSIFRQPTGAPFRSRQHLGSTCLELFDTNHDWGPLLTRRGRQGSNWLNAELPAEDKLREVFLLTRGTKRKLHQVSRIVATLPRGSVP